MIRVWWRGGGAAGSSWLPAQRQRAQRAGQGEKATRGGEVCGSGGGFSREGY